MTPAFFQKLQAHQDRLNACLADFQRVKVLVIGDLTLDEFLVGAVERLSREAPVLILRHEHTQQIPGGGANAAYNLAKLGAQVKVAGIVGQDSQGEALCRIFAAAGIDTTGIIHEAQRPTVTKTRISGHARQSVTQQIVRIDRKSDALPSHEIQSQLVAYIRSQIPHVDAVVCSDYGDGVFNAAVIEAALEHPHVIVDAQRDLHRFRGAMVFTPNLPEAEQAVGQLIETPTALNQAAQTLLEQTQAKFMLITRGEDGMSLFHSVDNQLQEEYIPAFNQTDVFDVTGAGDTVVAAWVLGFCAGATPWEATVLGNLGASIVVRTFGTATTSVTEMQETLQLLLDEGLEN
ncbi:bifunctional heptose 7-phosphate kinase/heptose 1-phosphate adenyltransferase [Synechococcus sp. BDU 130192]|uniref:bifunctional heptose 7-phosphate kinase/heptose 1-phosphate adenyltransferase n=2 Tax=Cyanophyceae TaxID=3028117 RepID=UPI000C0701B5|nr:PfkB family carbohydrate kinase [Synechococcus sp. BDU 130192]